MAKKRSKNTQTEREHKPVNLYLFIGLMIILLPLLFSQKTIDPVLGIRMLAWNIFMIVMLIPVIFGLFEKKMDFRYLRLNLFKIFTTYLIITVFSALFAVNAVESFFDISKTLLSLELLVIATALFVKYQNFRTLITRGFIISILIAGLNGLFQYFNVSPVNTDTEMFSKLYEIGGIMGHKNHFAISLFLLLPFSLFGITAFRRTWLVLSVIALVIIFVNIVLLQTRSVWLATIVFLVVNGLLMITLKGKDEDSRNPSRLKKPLLIAMASFVMIALVLFIVQPKETKGVFGYKIKSLMSLESHDNKGRANVWEATAEMISEKPLTGVGAGNWKIQIPVYIADVHGQSYQNWNQPHNDFLWILSEKGIFGLLAYLGIFAIVFYYALRIIRKTSDQSSIVFYSLLLSAIVGYLVLALVSFPYERVNHQVVLMIMFAAIMAGYIQTKKNISSIRKNLPVSIFGLSFVLLVLSLVYTVNAWNSKKDIKLMYAAIEKDNPRAVAKYATDALNHWVSLDVQTTPIYKHRGTAYYMLGREKEAISDLKMALKAHPNHISTLVNLASIYGKKKQLDPAIKYLEEAMKLFPKNQPTIKNLARAYFESGQIEKAYATILKYDNNISNPQIGGFIARLEKQINSNNDN